MTTLALLPPPPSPGSAQQAADLDTYKRTRALRDTPRWALAAKDANRKFPAAASTFECALQIPISQQGTPHLSGAGGPGARRGHAGAGQWIEAER